VLKLKVSAVRFVSYQLPFNVQGFSLSCVHDRDQTLEGSVSSNHTSDGARTNYLILPSGLFSLTSQNKT